MDATFIRSARARYGAALVVMGVIAFEVLLGGQAINKVVQQAVQVQASATMGHMVFR